MTKYMIIPYADLTDSMVTEGIETSRDTLRHSVPERGVDRVILKYATPMPSVFSGLTKYNHSEIREILFTDEWTKSEEDILEEL